MAALEKEIELQEAKLAEIESKISEGDTSAQILEEYSECKKKVEALMEEWEAAGEELNG